MGNITPAAVVVVGCPILIITLGTRIMAQPKMVTNFVAKFIALRRYERQHSVSAAKAVLLYPVAVFSLRMVYNYCLGKLGLFLTGHPGAGNAPVGQVDTHAKS